VGQPSGSVRDTLTSETAATASQRALHPFNRMILPHVARYTIGVVAVGSRRYIDWLVALSRSVIT